VQINVSKIHSNQVNPHNIWGFYYNLLTMNVFEGKNLHTHTFFIGLFDERLFLGMFLFGRSEIGKELKK